MKKLVFINPVLSSINKIQYYFVFLISIIKKTFIISLKKMFNNIQNQ